VWHFHCIIPKFDVICDRLLNRHAVTWNLFGIFYDANVKKKKLLPFNSCCEGKELDGRVSVEGDGHFSSVVSEFSWLLFTET